VTRRRWLNAARILFLTAAVWFAWFALRDEWPEVLAAVAEVGWWRGLLSLALVLVGLTVTGITWRRILQSYGFPLPASAAASAFFVGQLGKYIPGSVLSLGAQAQMAQRWSVPARTTVATGLVFLYWNLATATLTGFLAIGLNAVEVNLPATVATAGLIVSIGAVRPRIVSALGTRLAAPGHSLVLRWTDCGLLIALMEFTWVMYGAALLVLDANRESSPSALALGTAVGAFTIAYAVGVLMVLAPAGLGAREATLAILLAPSIGLSSAAAIALVARAVHTLADFSIAAAAWLSNRRRMSQRDGDQAR